MAVTYETKMISRDTFLAWIDLVGASDPDIFNGSRGRVYGTLENGVGWQLNFTAIFMTDDGGSYFGREYSWNAIRVATCFCNAFNFFRAGARQADSWEAAADLLELLTGVSAR